MHVFTTTEKETQMFPITMFSLGALLVFYPDASVLNYFECLCPEGCCEVIMRSAMASRGGRLRDRPSRQIQPKFIPADRRA